MFIICLLMFVSALRAIAVLVVFPPLCAAAPDVTSWPIVELRQYTLLPGQRDALIDLFEAEFVESQEAVGMKILGTFRDLDKPDRFVWLRGFKDMQSRSEPLKAFYSGPVWKTHGKAASATMVDASNVLVLHVAGPDSGFPSADRARAPKGTATTPSGLIVVTIYYLGSPAAAEFVPFFEKRVRPQLEAAGFPVLASFVTENSPNNFPRLAVRENEQVFVWFTKVSGQPDYERHQAQLASSPEWKNLTKVLQGKLKAPPEVLRLQPTARSELR